jgi:hypothetical protein
MLTDATQTLIATARDADASDEEFDGAAHAFVLAAREEPVEQVNAALAELSNHFDTEDASRGAFVALICGAFVENGCDPKSIAQPLTEQLAHLLKLSLDLLEACRAEMPDEDDDVLTDDAEFGEDDDFAGSEFEDDAEFDEAEELGDDLDEVLGDSLDEDDDIDDEDLDDLFQQVRERLGAEMPKEDEAWEALERLWHPAIAVYSVSPESREAARPLRKAATELAEFHEAGHWLRLMLGVLDDEPILVIEPSTSRGMLGRISGVVDNFQLNVLIMDTFPAGPGDVAPQRVDALVADVARGTGPQQTEDTVTGEWNLYNWQAIQSNYELPDPNDYSASQHWIWNEGSPEDIAVFEGRRVVLLGPASYARSWQAQRMFSDLPAAFEVERTLDEDEVRQWLERMIAERG